MSPHPHEALSAYLDGELDPAARREVETHTGDCAECAALLQDLRRLAALNADEGVPPLPEDLGHRILVGLEARMAAAAPGGGDAGGGRAATHDGGGLDTPAPIAAGAAGSRVRRRSRLHLAGAPLAAAATLAMAGVLWVVWRAAPDMREQAPAVRAVPAREPDVARKSAPVVAPKRELADVRDAGATPAPSSDLAAGKKAGQGGAAERLRSLGYAVGPDDVAAAERNSQDKLTLAGAVVDPEGDGKADAPGARVENLSHQAGRAADRMRRAAAVVAENAGPANAASGRESSGKNVSRGLAGGGAAPPSGDDESGPGLPADKGFTFFLSERADAPSPPAMPSPQRRQRLELENEAKRTPEKPQYSQDEAASLPPEIRKSSATAAPQEKGRDAVTEARPSFRSPPPSAASETVERLRREHQPEANVPRQDAPTFQGNAAKNRRARGRKSTASGASGPAAEIAELDRFAPEPGSRAAGVPVRGEDDGLDHALVTGMLPPWARARGVNVLSVGVPGGAIVLAGTGHLLLLSETYQCTAPVDEDRSGFDRIDALIVAGTKTPEDEASPADLAGPRVSLTRGNKERRVLTGAAAVELDRLLRSLPRLYRSRMEAECGSLPDVFDPEPPR